MCYHLASFLMLGYFDLVKLFTISCSNLLRFLNIYHSQKEDIVQELLTVESRRLTMHVEEFPCYRLVDLSKEKITTMVFC